MFCSDKYTPWDYYHYSCLKFAETLVILLYEFYVFLFRELLWLNCNFRTEVPHRFWGPTNVLFNGYQVFSPQR